MFRKLRADEIDVRVAKVNKFNISLLLYKDARADMNILDETVGVMYWKRQHTRENANCIVSIYNETIKEWISKEDTGTESYTEAEKGLASDSFKRACVNWGIGRELYTSPFIWIGNTSYLNGTKVYEKFSVKEIEYFENRIIKLVIQDSKDKEVFHFEEKKEAGNEMTVKQKRLSYILKKVEDNNLHEKLGAILMENGLLNLSECSSDDLLKIKEKLEV